MEPLWLHRARGNVGVREIPGAKHSPSIMRMAERVKQFLGIPYTSDETAWCGMFVAFCFWAVGIIPPKIAIRATEWAKWGVACTPCIGSVLVFQRPGGGHVGFYVGETHATYKVLGGNQGNAVSIVDIAKERLIASRWPHEVPITTLRQHVNAVGEVSRDEA